MNKKCTSCHQLKSFENFHKSKTGKYGISSTCKLCVSEIYKNNRDEHKKRTYQWRKDNPDGFRAITKRAYRKHREKKLAYAKQYRETHRDSIREKARQVWKARPEKMKKAIRSWKVKNKEKVNIWNEERRFRLLGNGGKFVLAEWENLCKRYGNKCLCCGKKTKLTIDHIVPLTMGGTNNIDNIQPLCQSCNSRKNNKIIDYRLEYQLG